jgi:hypothetical protein
LLKEENMSPEAERVDPPRYGMIFDETRIPVDLPPAYFEIFEEQQEQLEETEDALIVAVGVLILCVVFMFITYYL